MTFMIKCSCLLFVPQFYLQTQLIGSHQPIVALVGDDVLLPCHLEPAVSVTYETVVWTKAGLKPKYIHYHQDGRQLSEKQDPSYSLRTRLFMDELPRGNVSMKIFSVKLADAGTYKCSLPTMKKESDVIGSYQPVKVLVSDDIILPCHLERGPGLDHVYRNRRDDPVSQDQNFKGRTSLFQDEMTRGNISLKLTDVTEQDAGNYTCSVPKLQRSSVTLVWHQLNTPCLTTQAPALCNFMVVKTTFSVFLLTQFCICLGSIRVQKTSCFGFKYLFWSPQTSCRWPDLP
uniref:Ig-like domain-containing protein n=1 Tax=Sparus aurata TaxID=8175 RepID=A0A671TPQ6_SPAAU